MHHSTRSSLNKKFFRVSLLPFIATLIVGSFLIGCTSTAPAAETSLPVSQSQSKDFSGQKITFLVVSPHVAGAEKLSDWFNEETGAVVQIVEVSYADLLTEILQDQAMTTSQFDVVEIWYPDIGTLVQEEALVDLTDFILQNEAVIQPGDFISELYDPYTLVEDKRWAIPWDGDTHILFYRKSLLEKYNLTPPKTWDDYLAVAQTITEKEQSNGIYGSAIMGANTPIIVVSSFLNRLGGYGGDLLDDKGQPVINSPEAIAALTNMIEQAKYALPTPSETDFQVSRDAFLTGKVAMVEQWTDIGIMAEDPAQSTIQGDWGAIQMPMGSGAKARHAPALNAGFSLGISSHAPNLEIAQAFVLFAARPDIMQRINFTNGGVDPTRVSILTSEEYQQHAPEVSAAAQAALNGATAWPSIPKTPELMEILSSNLVIALEGKKSPQQALDDTQASWEKILSSDS